MKRACVYFLIPLLRTQALYARIARGQAARRLP
jgi:hypothetical protein